jgi:hypothetical protein
MSMTTTPTIPAPKAHLPLGSWVRRNLTWVLVALAVAATIVILAVVLTDGSGTDTLPASITDAPSVSDSRMSITALDHEAAEVGASSQAQSITALDHQADDASELHRQQSISAIDHAAESGR